jgi:hypothetical protein
MGELSRLVGDAKFEMTYRQESREVSFTPPLAELARLGSEAQSWAANLVAQPAPSASLNAIRTSAIKMLEAVAEFHAWQVDMLARFTPESIEDGSYKSLSAEFGTSLQPKVDALTPYVAQFNGVLSGVSTGLQDTLARIETSAPTRE